MMHFMHNGEALDFTSLLIHKGETIRYPRGGGLGDSSDEKLFILRLSGVKLFFSRFL